jgi:hypothetical protein
MFKYNFRTFAVAAAGIAFASVPASAASNTASVAVAVTAATEATIGVSYSDGGNIS